MAVKKVSEKKTEAVKAEEVKAAAKAAEVKEEPAKAAKKAPAKKAPAKKTAAKSAVKVQFGGAEYDIDEIVATCKADYKTKSKAAVKSINVYVKPEEATAYYVVNDDFSDKVEL
ncbi:MAG: DUF6465 family protein [Oscillospiraceae bacterium]